MNVRDFMVWQATGSLTPWNTRDRMPRTFWPDHVLGSFELESLYRFEESSNFQSEQQTTLSISKNVLASTHDSGEVTLQNKHTLSKISSITAHESSIFDFKWRQTNTNGSDNNARNFITASGDRSIVFWDAERCKPVSHFYSAHTGSVKTLSFHDANVFASGGRDGMIKLWDLRSSVSAIKCGPEFCIEDTHSNKLPPVTKSPKVLRTSRARQGNTFVTARSMKKDKHSPSNVVTCVSFKPQFNYHLLSCGVADNTIKKWDIRRCRNQYHCSGLPTPIGVHSIKNCYQKSSSLYHNNHGFRNLIIQHTQFGNVLLASCSDNRIYAFLNDDPNPVLCFSGCRSNLFTKNAIFKDNFLLSGSTVGKVFAWNLLNSIQNAIDIGGEQNSIPSVLPIYEMKIGEDREDISCVTVDNAYSRIYHTDDNSMVYQWSLFSPPLSSHDERWTVFAHNPPVCRKYVKVHDNLDKPISIRRDEALCTKSSSPLSLSNWIQTPKNNTNTSDEPNAKRPKLTSCVTPSTSQPSSSSHRTSSNSVQQSQTTSKKTPSSRRKPGSSKKQLFLNNRKISEFFTP